jgi:muramoyltetrapeptide carboxypeptidase
MLVPPLLKRGDTVALTATSGPCDPARLAVGAKVLEKMGLRCHITESCYAREGFLAGTDGLRLRDLHQSFAAPHIRGIFVVRGGYGAQRLLPCLDFALIKNNPKVFAGYSDVTALHIAINQMSKLVTFHAPMPVSDFGGGEVNELTLQAFGEAMGLCKPRKLLETLGQGLTVLVPGCAAAPLTGGNLSMITSTLGTPYEIDTHNKILFLEEINEDPYKIDRMLLQLKYAGKLSAAKGIILGDFSPQTLETMAQSIRDIIIPQGLPTVAGLPCGHTSPNITLPLGTPVEINSRGVNFYP